MYKVSNKALHSPIVATESPATQGFPLKFLEGDRTHRSPKDFEKLNIDTFSLQNGGVA